MALAIGLGGAAAGVLGLAAIATGARGHSLQWQPGMPVNYPPGAAVASAHAAGYVLSGHTFRYAQAVITLPTAPCGPGQPVLYVALAGTGGFARAGLACAHAGSWRAFVTIHRASPPATVTATFPLTRARPGDGVVVTAGLRAPAHTSRPAAVRWPGATVRANVTIPGEPPRGRTMALPGVSFGQVQALAGWSGGRMAVPARHTRLTQFLSGAVTTTSGIRGTFQGKWPVRPWKLARGSPPAVLAAPGYLWTDGTQNVYGATGDAFGIWLSPAASRTRANPGGRSARQSRPASAAPGPAG